VRADRLVAALLVLQARGRVTAAELGRELEISERTARRDLEALAIAGVPVYPQRGRGGGWSLIGGARTDLSGLTADEARALLLVAGPAAATPAVKAALRKFIRALPEPFRLAARAVALADTDMIGVLRSVFGTRLSVGAGAGDGRVFLEVRGHSPEVLGSELAGFADDLEVLEPAAVRRHLAHVGQALVRSYGSSGRGATERRTSPPPRRRLSRRARAGRAG
jgi:predicted DNA-binding transcriptional regulator YafY